MPQADRLPNDPETRIREATEAVAPRLIEIRRDIHTHPELAFQETRTAGIVAAELSRLGLAPRTGIGRTGVVAEIKGGRPGPTLAIRADMDALPIHEQTGVEYASKTPGKMHACGHDGHTTMLMGAAKYLAETRNFDGTAVMIFQPAEEGGGGGREMCADGMMDRWSINEVYGMHNMPGIPLGQFAIRPGAMMAAADQFEIVVTGKGGHAAKPHDCIDTTVVAAHIIVALQTIASRGVDPLKQVVVSVCTVATDSTAHNVIPQVVKMKGTARTMDFGVQDFVERRVKEIAEGTALALGAMAEVTYTRGYPVTVNTPENTDFAADVARAVSGKVDTDTAPLMGAEDFSFMLLERPGAYIFLGNGDTAMVHHPAYNFDDSAIPFGSSWYAGMVEARLPAA
jgi:hippurate hydrolase